MDSLGVEVVRRLQGKGHETYFVGGCVRDLLLGRQPKDFDIATSAKPREVQRLFRRARVIGRRFRLVHVHQRSKVFEVATFRKAPPEALEDEVSIIRDDNMFGTAREDALRRDFTVNGLFLDPLKKEIVDYVGGLDDLAKKQLRVIGDPLRRFQEDPVRVLRLIKFYRRLHLQPREEEVAAAWEVAPLIEKSAPPRVVEEVFRLMVTGDMAGVLSDLYSLKVLPIILPELAEWLERSPTGAERLEARIRILDEWIREQDREPPRGLLLATLFGPLVEDEFRPDSRSLDVRDANQVPARVFGRLQGRARLPRAVLSKAGRILLAQRRMDPPPNARKRGKRWEPDRLLELDFFPEALEYLRCRLVAEERGMDLYDEWQERYLAAQEAATLDA